MKTWQPAALAHAEREYPREACGLVVRKDGKDSYWPCTNVAETAEDQFEISAQDYAAAEDAGEVVAIFHSHPNASCHPSDADRVACEGSELPWHIVGVPSGAWGFCAPEGYVAPYEGRTFHHGILDCYSIIVDWYHRERGIVLTNFNRGAEWWTKGGNLYRENFAKTGFREVPADKAQHGDVILMKVQANVENHAAILLDGNVILHHIQDRLSCRETYDGYWRRVTTAVLRHEQCAK